MFLGYSLPSADLQAHFIFGRGSYSQTGAAKVTIVNPDQEAGRRIEAVAGPDIPCTWEPKRIEDWLEEQG